MSVRSLKPARHLAPAVVLAAAVTAGAVAAAVPATAVTMAAPTTTGAAVRVGTATTAVRDAGGAVWDVKHGFVNGRPDSVLAPTVPIANTTSPQLYRTGVFGMSAFTQPVAAGTYSVTLKMSENYFKKSGSRVFDVAAEGRTVLSGVDILKSAGYRTAYDRTFTVAVSDGTLSLNFTAIHNYPSVTAISITPVSVAAVPPPSTPSNAVPGPTNTGVPAGTPLTVHQGDLVVTTPGATYSNLDIHGYVKIKAPNVTIRNSIVRGADFPAPQGSWALVQDTSAAATNFLIEDSELVPSHPSMWVDGINGWNYTANRLNIHGTVDTAKVFGDNATIENSWLHDTIYYTNDPVASGGHTHNDGVQVQVGNNIHITHNSISGANNSVMQVTQDSGVVTNLVFDGNIVDGGGCSINLATKVNPAVKNAVTVTNTRFGRNQRLAGCAIIAGPGTILKTDADVWNDNNAPVAVSKGS